MSVTDLSGDLAHHLPTALVGNAVLDYGDRALMVQCGSTAEVLAWAQALRAAALPGVVDIVPAARTVLVKLDDPGRQGLLRQRLRKMNVTAASTPPAERHADVVIDVVYDGPDLAEVAEHTGLTIPQLIDAHTGTPWQVGFSGFAPGFAYLVDGDPRLRVPRRAEP
ncbi:allophanate hydrolase, partial [Mycobacterium avium subsp. hominissuis 10-5606]